MNTRSVTVCRSKEALFAVTTCQPLKTSALLEHMWLAWRGTNALVSTNTATIEHVLSTISTDSLNCRTIQYYKYFPPTHDTKQFPVCESGRLRPAGETKCQ